MTNNMDALAEYLGIDGGRAAPVDLVPASEDTSVVVGEVVETAADIKVVHERELEEDIQVARTAMKKIAERAASAAEAAILLAESGDDAKAFDSVARMTEAIVKANKELIELHRTRKETLDKKEPKAPLLPNGNRPVNIEKAVFVGRASDLLRELRDIDKGQKALPADAETT